MNILQFLIRYFSYPIIMALSLWIVLLIAYEKINYFPYGFFLILSCSFIIAILEIITPYHKQWLNNFEDIKSDILHAIFNISLILLTSEIISYIPFIHLIPKVWPSQIPIWIQFICIGLIFDFGLWVMHYFSHKKRWLWKLHAIHHQPSRLYWLNAEKRHPFSALILALPSLTILVLFGAPQKLIGSWMVFMAVHLAFQHANLDYRTGILKYCFATAEVHRWHHKHGFGQKNLAEVFSFWDILFSTFHYQITKVPENEVGLKQKIPQSYYAQLIWPFKK